jgi:hypothetical protein
VVNHNINAFKAQNYLSATSLLPAILILKLEGTIELDLSKIKLHKYHKKIQNLFNDSKTKVSVLSSHQIIFMTKDH